MKAEKEKWRIIIKCTTLLKAYMKMIWLLITPDLHRKFSKNYNKQAKTLPLTYSIKNGIITTRWISDQYSENKQNKTTTSNNKNVLKGKRQENTSILSIIQSRKFGVSNLQINIFSTLDKAIVWPPFFLFLSVNEERNITSAIPLCSWQSSVLSEKISKNIEKKIIVSWREFCCSILLG